MNSYTLLLDLAGLVAQDTTGHHWMTVGGVALPTANVEQIRKMIRSNMPKWSNSTSVDANEMIEFIIKNSLVCQVLRIRKSQPAWNNFWIDGNNFHQRIASIEKNRVGFVKPSTIIKIFCIW